MKMMIMMTVMKKYIAIPNFSMRGLPIAGLAMVAAFLLTACNLNYGGEQNASADQNSPSISVTGQAERSIQPDQAELSFSVEHRNPSQDVVRDQTNRAIRQITGHLSDVIGVADKKIQTTNLIVRPVYQRCRRNQPDKLNKDTCDRERVDYYTARTTLSVQVGDLTRLSDTIDGALNNGADRLANLRFSHSNRHKLMRDVRADAMRDAIKNAAVVAGAANKQIGNPLSIDVSANRGGPPRPMRAMAMSAGSKQVADTPVNPGEIQLTATVQARFELVD